MQSQKAGEFIDSFIPPSPIQSRSLFDDYRNGFIWWNEGQMKSGVKTDEGVIDAGTTSIYVDDEST